MPEVFGKSSAPDGAWGAVDCLRGDYTEAEQMPDPDLGKSVRPGFRNVSKDPDRVFGLPSLRTDVPRTFLSSSSFSSSSSTAGKLVNSVTPTFSHRFSTSFVLHLFLGSSWSPSRLSADHDVGDDVPELWTRCGHQGAPQPRPDHRPRHQPRVRREF